MSRPWILLPVLIGTALLLATWRRSHRTRDVFGWDGRRVGLHFSSACGLLRVYWQAMRPFAKRRGGFFHKSGRMRVLFRHDRSPMDTFYWGWAGFTLAAGENTYSGTRYALASVPFRFVATVWLAIVVGVSFQITHKRIGHPVRTAAEAARTPNRLAVGPP